MKTKNVAMAKAVTFVVKSRCFQMTRRFISPVLIGLILCALAAAQSTPVRVLSSNGVRAAFQEFIPQAERAVGRPLSVEFATSAAIKRSIETNESFDVTILASDVIDALTKEGKLVSQPRIDIGRAGVGVGILAGKLKPDIRTPDAIKQALMNSKGVTYAGEGASRPAIDKMIQDLGITDPLKAKTKLTKSTDESMEVLRSGQSEIVMTLISEIMPVKGVDLVGPIPSKFQSYVMFSIGVSPNSRNKDAAKALIDFITGPAAASTFKAKGIEPHK
jgi:molybdate transport system substrate-binding protein